MGTIAKRAWAGLVACFIPGKATNASVKNANRLVLECSLKLIGRKVRTRHDDRGIEGLYSKQKLHTKHLSLVSEHEQLSLS